MNLSVEEYYNVGSFWTNRQRQAHSLNEISYRACFKPQLPSYFIERFTSKGDVVLDPFMGRGTTALQAALAGRTAYSSDINPLGEMLVLPRLEPPNLEDVEKRFTQIPPHWELSKEDDELSVFFHRKTLQHLMALKNWFVEKEKTGEINQ